MSALSSTSSRRRWQPLRSLSQAARAYLRVRQDPRPKVAYVGGWLGKDNLGDELLYDAMGALCPHVQFVHFAGGRVARSFLRTLPGIRAGVLGGGTLIAQKRQWLETALEFTASGRELVVFGSGVEESEFWAGDTTVADWKPLLSRCRTLGVRGPLSVQLLEAAGLKHATVVGDPVLALASRTIEPNPRPRTLGLNLGVSDGKLWGDEARVGREMEQLAARAKAAGWAVEWFVIWPKDLELTRKVAAASGTADCIHVVCRDYRDFMRRVAPLTAFVGMKLHATALATCALTPSVMLEYRPKCRDYMQSIDQDAATFRTDQFTADGVWELVDRWGASRPAVVDTLARGVWRAQDRQRAAAAATPHLNASKGN